MEYLNIDEFCEMFNEKHVPQHCQLIFDQKFAPNNEHRFHIAMLKALSRKEDKITENELLEYLHSLTKLQSWDGNQIILTDNNLTFLPNGSYYEKRYLKFMKDFLKTPYFRILILKDLKVLKKLTIPEIKDLICLDTVAYNMMPLFRKWLHKKQLYPNKNFTIRDL